MDASPKQTAVRRAYGRGYFDALRAMEIDPMTPARLTQAEQAVNGIARKVLDAVPKQEPWTINKIVAELNRAGRNLSTDVVLGCLSTMTRSGLLKEVEPRTFIRVTARERAELAVVPSPPPQAPPAAAAQASPEPAPAASAAPGGPDTLAKLASLSTSVRSMAVQFTALAEAIDDVALEVEQRIERISCDSDKLAQLRALLKSVGS